jgi:OOP family OmpA-OmpF porin
MRVRSNLIMAILASSSVPALSADPPIAAPGYVQDSSGKVVMSGSGACWHTSDWTPAKAVVVGCDGVLAKAIPIPPPPPTAQTQPPAPPVAEGPPLVLLPPAVVAASRPVVEKITLDTDTYFDFDKAELKPDGERKLDVIASRLKELKLEVMVAVGHADANGTAAYNENLSRRRAESVKMFFESRGFPADRIQIDGKGESQPVASNATRDGRAKNRRVEVEVVGTRPQE